MQIREIRGEFNCKVREVFFSQSREGAKFISRRFWRFFLRAVNFDLCRFVKFVENLTVKLAKFFSGKVAKAQSLFHADFGDFF